MCADLGHSPSPKASSPEALGCATAFQVSVLSPEVACPAFPKNMNGQRAEAEVMGVLVLLSVALSWGHFPLVKENLYSSKHTCRAQRSLRKPGFSQKPCGVWNKSVMLIEANLLCL